MKVSISAITRFHIFDLARQMERLGHLERLYTGVPRWMIKEIPLGKVRSMPWLVGPIVLAGRCGMRRIPRILHLPATVVHDRWVARSLTETDVFHCLSSMGTLSLRAAQERFGALAVCDRSSSHILYQLELVRDEYDRLGIPWRGIPSGAIERELADYETADVIVLPSEFAFRSFIDRGFPVQKLRKVPFGVDLSMFRPIEKEDSKFRIIFVGALSVQKGVVYLLEAVESLKDTELW
jgi:starch synthase